MLKHLGRLSHVTIILRCPDMHMLGLVGGLSGDYSLKNNRFTGDVRDCSTGENFAKFDYKYSIEDIWVAENGLDTYAISVETSKGYVPMLVQANGNRLHWNLRVDQRFNDISLDDYFNIVSNSPMGAFRIAQGVHTPTNPNAPFSYEDDIAPNEHLIRPYCDDYGFAWQDCVDMLTDMPRVEAENILISNGVQLEGANEMVGEYGRWEWGGFWRNSVGIPIYNKEVYQYKRDIIFPDTGSLKIFTNFYDKIYMTRID